MTQSMRRSPNPSARGTSPGPSALLQAGEKGALYREIAQLLKNEISAGQIPAGSQLPSIAELSRSYRVAIVTIRKALHLLEQDGYVRLRQGVGTFVNRELPPQAWLRLESSWSSMIAMWEHTKPQIVEESDVSTALPLRDGEGVAATGYRYMRRIHRREDIPYAVVDLYIDMQLYSRMPDRFRNEMAIVVLESMDDVRIENIIQNLVIGSADVNIAHFLNIAPNAPVGRVRRIITNTDNRVLYLGEAIYRGDIVSLEMNFRRN